MDILSKADYVRVTEVLSMFNDFSMVHPDILKAAQTRGTEVHIACDSIMITEELSHVSEEDRIKWIEENKKKYIPEDYMWEQNATHIGQLQSFSKWAKGKKFPFAKNKIQRFYDDELFITGEIDGIYETEQGLVLIDIKTSAAPSKTWALQTSAYSYMCKKHGYDIQRIEVLKLDKEGKMPKVYLYQENMDLFRKVLDVYRYFKQKDLGDK